ncbi:Golgi-associated plant pathogenesis-related protein 1-like isoform X2 [Biomphalaria glabrata]|uniref:Golgi-associated plant pathogenesis-related protein 1-like isoform X2 n=1 Tax=Biomphalaria glabrata TaxID=6526 RepID=A0A2C9K7Z9_BIOGL|nr:Golgi-associated plant pathogenesis-related protein 1-like isoform X2 [Biomphalaria glabrata]
MGCISSKKQSGELSPNPTKPSRVVIHEKVIVSATETGEVTEDNSPETKSADEFQSSSKSSDGSVDTVRQKWESKMKDAPEKSPPLKPIDRIRQEALEAHNKYRQMHGSPPLELSSELNRMAQQWAEHLAVTTSFEHSPKEKREGTGENLAAHTDIITGDQVTDMWYNEIEDYDFSQPGFKLGTGHFTQLIWRNTTHMGLGMSSQTARDGMYRFVANYRPSGNWKGEFQENVLPRITNH